VNAGDVLAPRLAAAFAAPRAGRAALIPYLTGGHLGRAASGRLIAAVIAAGADVVELGVPFSDPIADGPVVQASTHEALLDGIVPDEVFALAAAHREAIPFVLLVYLNPVLAYGPERFFERAAASGVEALVIPDLPVDEATAPGAHGQASLAEAAAAEGVALVPLAAPTSTDGRLDAVADAARSFIYCVAVTGVTGARKELGAELPALVARLRTRTEAPLAAGFGISTPDQAAAAAAVADGVIIGSALIAAAARAAREGGAGAAAEAAGSLVRAAGRAIAKG
jgi:tryptophan synthase alpha chain